MRPHYYRNPHLSSLPDHNWSGLLYCSPQLVQGKIFWKFSEMTILIFTFNIFLYSSCDLHLLSMCSHSSMARLTSFPTVQPRTPVPILKNRVRVTEKWKYLHPWVRSEVFRLLDWRCFSSMMALKAASTWGKSSYLTLPPSEPRKPGATQEWEGYLLP